MGFYSNNTYTVVGSAIYMTSHGSIYGTNSTYEDYKNPIICKYWYFDMQ